MTWSARRSVAVAAVLLFAAAGEVAAQRQNIPPRPDRGGKIAWRSDIEAAQREAARDHRPGLMYFTADW